MNFTDAPDKTEQQRVSATRENILKESSSSYATTKHDIDLSLLDDSLAKTPWERMLANDDALNFAESLRTAMEQRNAKP